MMETEIIADEGPCDCPPSSHRIIDSRFRPDFKWRRRECTECNRRWTTVEIGASEYERLREIESATTLLLKAIGK